MTRNAFADRQMLLFVMMMIGTVLGDTFAVTRFFNLPGCAGESSLIQGANTTAQAASNCVPGCTEDSPRGTSYNLACFSSSLPAVSVTVSGTYSLSVIYRSSTCTGPIDSFTAVRTNTCLRGLVSDPTGAAIMTCFSDASAGIAVTAIFAANNCLSIPRDIQNQTWVPGACNSGLSSPGTFAVKSCVDLTASVPAGSIASVTAPVLALLLLAVMFF